LNDPTEANDAGEDGNKDAKVNEVKNP